MTTRASRTGLVVSALGGIATVVAAFLPWYAIGITPAAVDFAAGAIDRAIPQLAGSAYDSQLRAAGNAAAGHQFVSVSAHQAFSSSSTVMLIAAGAAILLALVALARPVPELPGGAGLLAGAGAIAGAIALWHQVSHPNPAPGLITVSVRGDAWLALLGSVAVVAGAMWPAESSGREASAAADQADAWSELSGWTPTA